MDEEKFNQLRRLVRSPQWTIFNEYMDELIMQGKDALINENLDPSDLYVAKEKVKQFQEFKNRLNSYKEDK